MFQGLFLILFMSMCTYLRATAIRVGVGREKALKYVHVLQSYSHALKYSLKYSFIPNNVPSRRYFKTYLKTDSLIPIKWPLNPQPTLLKLFGSEAENSIISKNNFLSRSPTRQYLLHISTSVWVLRTPNAGRNSLCSGFYQNPLMGVLAIFFHWYLCNHRYNVCRV